MDLHNSRQTGSVTAVAAQRRHLFKLGVLSLCLGLSMAAFAQTESALVAPGEIEFRPERRLALLISNGDYPKGKELPPARKNFVDMRDTLTSMGFKVRGQLDADQKTMRRELKLFSDELRSLGGDWSSGRILSLVYFFGHGLEIDGTNVLVPAGVDPTARGVVDQSVNLLSEIVAPLPTGYPGTNLVFVDACRVGFNTDAGKLNQVEPPPGCVLVFGTRAGRPALSPKDDKRNSYFTQAILQTLQQHNGVTPLDDLCQIVENRCLENVKAEFERLGLKTIEPQYPQTSANLRGNFVLPPAGDRPPPPSQAEADARWAAIQAAVLPRDVKKKCDEFLLLHADSVHVPAVQARRKGAIQVIEAVRRKVAGQTLPGFLSEDTLDRDGGPEYVTEVAKAMRGDKDAAKRVADAYEAGAYGLRRNPERQDRWLRFAMHLGNGIAAWSLRERSRGSAAEGQYEEEAVRLGYRPRGVTGWRRDSSGPS